MPSHASICGWYSSTCSLAASKLRGQARVAAVGVCGVAASPASGASASQAAISALVCFIRNDMGFSGRTLAGTMLHNRRPTRESRLARQWEQSDLKTFRIRQKKDRSAGWRAACGQCLHKPGIGPRSGAVKPQCAVAARTGAAGVHLALPGVRPALPLKAAAAASSLDTPSRLPPCPHARPS
ncbi:exported hypothetical protein [Cupriavidus taiwanensis]|nr:exported hypothetical protein [Cupriavidus taiwanensis]SOZ80927.1 exported hypothetical protein [Cupriavidus taiwanensis]SPD44604.1 protein of unknown function [Cupriavidus taiwanensis]